MFTTRSFNPQFVYLGIVTSIECNHKQVDSARKGQEVCVKIENVPGETPKLYGRHFDETDMLVSKVSAWDMVRLLLLAAHYNRPLRSNNWTASRPVVVAFYVSMTIIRVYLRRHGPVFHAPVSGRPVSREGHCNGSLVCHLQWMDGWQTVGSPSRLRCVLAETLCCMRPSPGTDWERRKSPRDRSASRS